MKKILTKLVGCLLLHFTFYMAAVAQNPVIITYSSTVNIQSIVGPKPAGTTYIIKSGMYRMQEITPKNGDKFIGEPGTILNGARILTAWTKDPQTNYWVHTGQTQQVQRYQACVGSYTACRFPEDLYKKNVPLRQEELFYKNSIGTILKQEEIETQTVTPVIPVLDPGEWFFDYLNDKVYMYDNPTDPANQPMEISVSRRAFGGSASSVTIQGLVVEKYAIPGHMAAIGDQFPGSGWVIENNEVRLNHGQGINFTGTATIRGNFIHHNGQMGLGGSRSTNAVVENNEMSYNTLPQIGFSWRDEGGASKFSESDGLIIRNNHSHHNYGPGLWTDSNNMLTLYEGNTIHDNIGPGIFHEISYDATIRCNKIERNKDETEAQILIANSKNVEVYNNKIVMDNPGGDPIMIKQGKRANTDSTIRYYSTGNYIHHNDITYLFDRKSTGATPSYDIANFWATGNNRFNFNAYHVPAVADASQQKRWLWGQNTTASAKNWNEFRALGQEANGTVDNNLTATAALTVNAGIDKTLTLPTSSTTLTGTSNYFGTYTWTKQSGSSATLTNDNTTTLSLTNLVAGTYVFRFTVNNGCGATAYDEITVTVYPPVTALYEAETIYTTLADVGTRGTVGISNCPSASGSSFVRLYDDGDKIKLTFNMALTGTYQVSVRLRSGDVNGASSFWPNGYAFTVNGTSTTFTGDASTLSAQNSCVGTAYWGTMRSAVINLTQGQNYVTVLSQKFFAAVDYLEVKRITPNGARLEVEEPKISALYFIVAYPNPFQDQVTLQTTSLPAGLYSFVLSDTFGKVHNSQEHTLQKEQSSLTLQFPHDGAHSGLYVLRIVSEENQVRKVIKLLRH
ncbi:MAG: right-handed parallel beta-helix repeat-containing protein [Bacteroidota bacterium]